MRHHASDPVRWHPEEKASRLAEILDKPTFLSMGSSACPSRHVIHQESFENAEIASILKRLPGGNAIYSSQILTVSSSS